MIRKFSLKVWALLNDVKLALFLLCGSVLGRLSTIAAIFPQP